MLFTIDDSPFTTMIRASYYFFYLLSLLPLWILYGLSDFFYLILFYIVGYRKEVVLRNLKNAFPNKNERELKIIRRRFYRCFMQNWIETIKLISMSRKALEKRITGNWEVVKDLHTKHPRIQILLGHCFNWEWGNANACMHQPYQLLNVYITPKSNAINYLFVRLRKRFGAGLLQAGHMAKEMLPYRDTSYMLGLVADQSPSSPERAYWLQFMHQPAGFIKGPEKNARATGTPLVYLSVSRLRRGYYHISAELLTEFPSATAEGEITMLYARRLQKDIEASPHTYMWTHRRWKLKWKKTYKNLWVDEKVKMPRA